jgi:hypothetical protein
MKSFKAPDLNAPRFRRKSINVLKNSLFDAFIKKYPEHKNITMSDFKNIIKSYNGVIWNSTIENRAGVELPEGLGYMFIGVCQKSRKSNTNYKKSKEYGVTVNHRNTDSDNYLAKIFYTNYKMKYRFKDRDLWKFKAVKTFKSGVAKTFKDRYAKYIFVENNKKISATYLKQVRTDYFNKLNEDGLKAYNPLELD